MSSTDIAGAQYVIRITAHKSGQVAFEHSGNVPAAIVLSCLDLVKLEILLPMVQRRQQAQRSQVPGMLGPNLKRIPTDEVKARYRVA